MPKLQDYKAILFDVDKTLTNNRREVTPRTKAVLVELQKLDILVGVCTGRSYPNLMKTVLPLFKDEANHILSGGSVVATSIGEIKQGTYIAGEATKEITAKAEEFGSGYCFPGKDVVYANHILATTYRGMGNALAPEFRPVEQATNFEVPIIPVLGTTLEFINYLGERDDVSFKEMKPYPDYLCVDVTPKGINKAVGISHWSEITGVQPGEIIGFGDSENDDEFLEHVGFGVAMGNATEYLKKKAKRVIGQADDDGLAIYLEQLLKGVEL
jgi:Cof subfamily protein (haloacid dehalogenase superfamily)